MTKYQGAMALFLLSMILAADSNGLQQWIWHALAATWLVSAGHVLWRKS